MLDLLFVAMFAIVIVMIASICWVRRRNFQLHRQIQIGLSAVLIVTVVLFEVDIRFFSDWQTPARESAFYDSGWVFRSLYIHLAFAIPTPFVWGAVVWMAVRNFGSHPNPGAHSWLHRRMGYLAAGLMLMTSMTGWIFYFLAFVA